MKSELITLKREDYERLKKKAEIADDAVVQLKLSSKDIIEGKISKF